MIPFLSRSGATGNPGRVSPMSIDAERSESKISVIPPLFSSPPTPDMYYDDDTPPSPAMSTASDAQDEPLPEEQDEEQETPDDNHENIPGTPAPGSPRNEPLMVASNDTNLGGSQLSVRSGSALIVPETKAKQDEPEPEVVADAASEEPAPEEESGKKKKKKKRKKSGKKSPKLD